MFLLALLACGPGTFTTPDGPEAIRSALYFQPDSALMLEVNGSRQVWVLLSNSTIPCHAKEVEDDPATESDEAAAAEYYWQAQVATAFLREGGLVVAMALAVGADEDWLGEYGFHSDAWDADAVSGYVDTDGRVAAGAWYQVEETAVEDGDGVLYANPPGSDSTTAITVEDADYDLKVGAPASVDITRKDTALAGTFTFDPDDFTGEFRAERCDNLDLLSELTTRLALLFYTLDDDDDDTTWDTGWTFDE